MFRPSSAVGIGLLLFIAASGTQLPRMSAAVPPSDPAFRYEGRFDARDPARPVFIWAGDRITVDFEGERLALQFGRAEGQAFFDVTVDGTTRRASGTAGSWAWPEALGPGRHHLQIVKRSEADAGHAEFLGLDLGPGGGVSAAKPSAYRLRVQFIGDSITAGANNEDGAVDQWEDRSTHNHVLSYGYLTSQALGADHRAMAVSGMGIAEGFVPMLAGETWNKVYPRKPVLSADLKGWVPHLVFVNLGENDDAFTRANGRPFPSGFAAGYVALIRAVRAAWPEAQIVLLRGGMSGGKNSEPLRAAWEKAVAELEAADPKVAHYVFDHWSRNHPRVADHRQMAEELTTWLKRQPFLTRLLP